MQANVQQLAVPVPSSRSPIGRPNAENYFELKQNFYKRRLQCLEEEHKVNLQCVHAEHALKMKQLEMENEIKEIELIQKSKTNL